MEYASFYIIFMSFNLTITLVIMLASCLCCRKKIPKNEFIGVEGMVILKNPEDNIICTNISEIKNSQNDLNVSTTSAADSDKRSSNAPHRSLPDIPLAVATNDTGSELYATVADKVHEKPQGTSPTLNTQKGTSVSQHSSISQADDVSSPYARVKASSHGYDKVLSAEHPYAQLSTVTAVNYLSTSPPNSAESCLIESSTSRRGSHQSITAGPESLQEIPAASAIAGMISASQELPYMTPPIVQPNFSGDSQDSSKGYTSISVREPLANIIAQTKERHSRLNRGGSDSHYATVSDDSDEMYAAIEDPKNLTDIYTSGSETYAQIQPSNAFTISVEINTISSGRTPENADKSFSAKNSLPVIESSPIPLPVDSLRAQMHSRQASSSSNTSSMGILGSPKPEKRQANSPLPPTPKNVQFNNAVSSNLASANSSIASGRNSVSSVIEVHFPLEGSIAEEATPNKKKLNSSKDLEEMYAKVMKKNRLSTSQNSSPILTRKTFDVGNGADDAILPDELKINDLEAIEMKLKTSPGKNSIKSAPYISDNKYEIVNKRRVRSNSYNSKDHGYETIPADKANHENNQNQIEKRKSDCYAQITQKERLMGNAGSLDSEVAICKLSVEPGYESVPDKRANNSDPGYETLQKGVTDIKKPNSDYDPNYETLHAPKYVTTNSDDGYAKVMEKIKPRIEEDDTIDGYSKVKIQNIDDDNIPGYSRIGEPKKNVIINSGTDKHGYASISEASNTKIDDRQLIVCIGNNNNNNINNNTSKIIKRISSHMQYPINLDEYQNVRSLSDLNKAAAPITLLPTSESSERLITSSSSDQSNIDMLNIIRGSSTISSIQAIPSNNYESLTGSESDPNYESVRYVRTESPYERIQSLANDLPPGNLKNSMTTGLSFTNGDINLSLTDLKTNHSNPDECGEVDDYFQV